MVGAEVREVTVDQVIRVLVSHCEHFGSYSGELGKNERMLSGGVN